MVEFFDIIITLNDGQTGKSSMNARQIREVIALGHQVFIRKYKYEWINPDQSNFTTDYLSAQELQNLINLAPPIQGTVILQLKNETKDFILPPDFGLVVGGVDNPPAPCQAGFYRVNGVCIPIPAPAPLPTPPPPTIPPPITPPPTVPPPTTPPPTTPPPTIPPPTTPPTPPPTTPPDDVPFVTGTEVKVTPNLRIENGRIVGNIEFFKVGGDVKLTSGVALLVIRDVGTALQLVVKDNILHFVQDPTETINYNEDAFGRTALEADILVWVSLSDQRPIAPKQTILVQTTTDETPPTQPPPKIANGGVMGRVIGALGLLAAASLLTGKK